MNTKTGLLIVGLVVAIGVAYWAFTGTSVDDGEEGAVAPANRYQATDDQVTDADVTLEDADVVALLQDDVFLELIQDEDFRELMARDDFAGIAARDGIAAVIERLPTTALAAHRDVIRAARMRELPKILEDREVLDILGARKVKDGSTGSSEPQDPKLPKDKPKYLDLENRLAVVLERNKHIAYIDETAIKGQKLAGYLLTPAMMELARREKLEVVRNPKYVEFAKRATPEKVKTWQAREDLLFGANIEFLGKRENLATPKTRWDRSSNIMRIMMRGKLDRNLVASVPMDYMGRRHVEEIMRGAIARNAFVSRENFDKVFGRHLTPIDGGGDGTTDPVKGKGNKDKG